MPAAETKQLPTETGIDEAKQQPRPGLFVLIVMSALGPIALNIFIPSMPGLQESFETDFKTAQLTLTFYLASLAISQLFVGSISDKFGRRPVLLIGTIIFVLASIACTFATTIEQLIIGRIFQAAGGCAGVALSRAIVRDLYPQDKAASLLSYVTMAMVIGPMMAPVVGGILDGFYGWRTGFYLVSILGSLVFILAMKQLYETNQNQDRKAGIRRLLSNCRQLTQERRFMAFALGLSFGSGVFFAFIASAPFIITRLFGGTPAEYGLYFIVVSIAYMVGNFISGRFAEKFGGLNLITWSSTLAVVGLTFLLVSEMFNWQSWMSVFLPMSIIAVSNGLMIPNATSAAISVRPDIAGSGAGLVGLLQIGTGTLSTFVVSQLHDGTRWPMVIVMVGSGLLSIVVLSIARKMSHRTV